MTAKLSVLAFRNDFRHMLRRESDSTRVPIRPLYEYVKNVARPDVCVIGMLNLITVPAIQDDLERSEGHCVQSVSNLIQHVSYLPRGARGASAHLSRGGGAGCGDMNIEHRSSEYAANVCSDFDVRCSMFDVRRSQITVPCAA